MSKRWKESHHTQICNACSEWKIPPFHRTWTHRNFVEFAVHFEWWWGKMKRKRFGYFVKCLSKVTLRHSILARLLYLSCSFSIGKLLAFSVHRTGEHFQEAIKYTFGCMVDASFHDFVLLPFMFLYVYAIGFAFAFCSAIRLFRETTSYKQYAIVFSSALLLDYFGILSFTYTFSVHLFRVFQTYKRLRSRGTTLSRRRRSCCLFVVSSAFGLFASLYICLFFWQLAMRKARLIP